jgi:hypothetical protein
METYFENTEGEYIISISTGTGGEEIAKEEYDNIISVIRDRPTAETGYDYRLKTDLTWELVELPPEPEHDPEATETDFLEALSDLGVKFDDEI